MTSKHNLPRDLVILKFLLAWPALAVLAALFVYCCGTLSDAARGQSTDEDRFAPKAPEEASPAQ